KSDRVLSLEGVSRDRSLWRVYFQGALINALNPKVALFFLAFLPQFVDSDQGPVAIQILVLGTVFFALGLISDSVYAVIAGSVGTWLQHRPNVAHRQHIAVSAVYFALGALAALANLDRGVSNTK
ncbi:MAG: LysE family translocator, partial [Chloroflexota bacterium]|nr:LysE family translocator [Chloroflexota bacterium]